MADYKTVSAKLGNVSDPTRAKSKEIFDAAKKAGHEIWYMWGMGSSSEHATGRALDLMVKNEAAGDWIRDYIWKNRQRLRLQHVIWEQHITSTVTQPGVRRKMADRGSVTENHYDHNHVLFFTGPYTPPGSDSGPVDPPKPGKRPITEVAKDVLAGKYGNGDTRIQRLRGEGYNPAEVQAEVNRLMAGTPPVRKSIREIASEVIAGKWGVGVDRVTRLTKAGYNSDTVQKEVNRLLGADKPRPKKSIGELASEVIAGKWGVDPARTARLRSAGYDADAVQKEVNRRL